MSERLNLEENPAEVPAAAGKVRIFFRLLGDFSVHASGTPVELPASKKTRALLGFLCASPGRHSRSRLCDLFFETAEDPRAALRWSLSKLRQSLRTSAGDVLSADRDAVELRRGGVDTDIDALDRMSARTTAGEPIPPEELTGLVRGEFLDGLNLPGCYGYHAWCLAERGRISSIFEDILRRQLELQAIDNPANALFAARTLVGRNPFDEAGHQSVIELLSGLGRHDEALQHYQQCLRILERELGVEPSSPLRAAGMALAAKLPRRKISRKRTAAAAPKHSAAKRRLVGRSAEAGLIAARVDTVIETGAPEVIFISGAPGIGKTRLLDEVERVFNRRGGHVLRTKSFESEAIRPLGLWSDLFEDPLIPAAAQDAAPTDFNQEMGRARLYKDVLDRLARRVSTCPVAVLIDDFHWADEASVALLSYLHRNLSDQAVLFALAARPGELEDNAPASAFLAAPYSRPTRLALTPLGQEAAAELVASMGKKGDAEKIVSLADGNPLFLTELARSGGRVSKDAKISGILASRLTGVSDEAQELFAWASVFGNQVPLRELVAASGAEALQASRLLEELERHDLINPAGPETYVMSHDLIQEAAYRSLSHPRRCLMHARVGQLLSLRMAAEPDCALDVLYHAGQGGDHALAGRAAVVAAGNALRAFANTEAAGIARRGLLHAASTTGDAGMTLRGELMRMLVHASSGLNGASLSALAGDLADLARDAGESRRNDVVSLANYLLSILHQERGDTTAAEAATLRAARASASDDTGRKLRQLANTARCLMELGRDVPRARELVRDAGALAEASGLEDVEIFWARGLLKAWDGATEGAIRDIGIAAGMAARASDRWREVKCLIWLSMLSYETGAHDDAVRHAGKLEALARRMGEGASVPLARVILALCHFANGGTAEEVETAIADLARADDKSYLVYALNMLAAAYFDRGNAERAVDVARRAIRVAEDTGAESEGLFARALLARCLGPGDAAGAARAMADLRRRLDAAPDMPARTSEMIRNALLKAGSAAR